MAGFFGVWIFSLLRVWFWKEKWSEFVLLEEVFLCDSRLSTWSKNILYPLVLVYVYTAF
jgi:hypothetical protein